MDQFPIKKVAIIVAHPDDETLWAGGTILGHPSWKCFIVSLCRGKDIDRAPKFYKALKTLRSEGIMGDLDDGPEQKMLSEELVGQNIMDLLPVGHYDIIISHNPLGEYTRHIRHEEIGKAVIKLWYANKISADELWIFAYEDGEKQYFPRPIEKTDYYHKLTKRIWLRKYKIITDIYGFENKSWEAETTPKYESFWKFSSKYDAINRLNQLENKIIQ